MLTAHDLHREHGFPLRTAQRLLARWLSAGLATTVTTGGRPALAVSPEAFARLTGCDPSALRPPPADLPPSAHGADAAQSGRA